MRVLHMQLLSAARQCCQHWHMLMLKDWWHIILMFLRHMLRLSCITQPPT